MKIIARSRTHVTSGVRGNKRAASISGVPGTNLSAAYAYVDLWVKLALAENQDLYVAVESGDIVQDGMVNAGGFDPWDVFLLAKQKKFTVTIPVGTTQLWPLVANDADLIDRKNWWHGETNSNFTGSAHWDAKNDLNDTSNAGAYGYKKLNFHIADLDIHYDSDKKITTGTIYMNFPILYRDSSAVTSPITLDSTAVSVDVTELVSYFPWSVRINNKWMSCNRQGGSFKVRRSNTWGDAKNSQSDSGTQHGFYRDSNTWKRLPKFGGE